MIGPGLAISAYHIISDIEDELDAGTQVVYLLGIHANAMMAWSVEMINIQYGNDICVLSLEPMSNLPTEKVFGRFALTTRAPSVGEVVHIIGFRHVKHVEIDDEKVIVGQMLVSAGTVSAVYNPYRDQVMVNFPAIEIDAGSLGGMSGGVVLDQESKILGVVSTSLGSEDNRGPTYAAWIIECLGRRLEFAWPPGIFENGPRLIDLPSPAIIVEGMNALSLNEQGELEYRMWSSSGPLTR